MSLRYLVVDGHSVIFSWRDLRALHDQNRAAARKALSDQLGHMHDTTPWRVTLVLDGKLGQAVPPRSTRKDEMVTCYATADQTADSIIERLVAASGVAEEVLVITADEVEKMTIESLGASVASPAWLREEMEKGAAAFSFDLERIHRSARWK
jgi:predicted RNA-binding protein with PIN domain